MNRRSFLKSSAALATAALVPSWFKMPSVPAIDLQAFCTDSWRRYDLSRPFVQEVADMGAARFATNGHICLRVPTAEIPQGDPEAKFPPANNLDWPDLHAGGWRKWPAQNYLDANDSDCPVCEGYGVYPMQGQCKTCDGEDLSWYAERRCPVPNCHHGNIGPVCTHCKGNAIGVFPSILPVGGLFVDAKLDRLMRRHLGGIEFKAGWNGPSNQSVVQFRVVQFRFDGGCGLLMPLDGDAAVKRLRKGGA